MGLDIVVYSNLGKRTRPRREKEQLLLRNHEFFAVNGDALDGYYSYPDKSLFRFRAGSYSGYGQWREVLCKNFLNPIVSAGSKSCYAVYDNVPKFKGKPFFELVYFSDCEGYIGPATSKKLYVDFQTHAAKAAQITEGFGFFETYTNFMNAFDIAAQNKGIVLFS